MGDPAMTKDEHDQVHGRAAHKLYRMRTSIYVMETIGRVHVALLTGLTAAQAAAARHTLVSERRPLALLDAAMVSIP